MGDISNPVHDSETSSRDIRAVCKVQASPQRCPSLPGCSVSPLVGQGDPTQRAVATGMWLRMLTRVPRDRGGIPRDQGDALRLPIRWQVSIKVTPITAASGLPLTRGWPGRQLRVTRGLRG